MEYPYIIIVIARNGVTRRSRSLISKLRDCHVIARNDNSYINSVRC